MTTEWDASTKYLPGAQVTHGGSTYTAQRSVVGVEPPAWPWEAASSGAVPMAYAAWVHHSGTPSPETGNFDYVDDLVASAGSTIVTDDSAGWIANWGYAVPMVTEEGTYALTLQALSAAAATIQAMVSVRDADANPIAPWGIPSPLESPYLVNAPSASSAVVGGSVVLRVPAETHFDLENFDATGATSGYQLIIQRIG